MTPIEMTAELTALALAALVHIVGFAFYSVRANMEVGPGYTTSPRDRAPSRALSEMTARFGRAYDNSAAMFGFFAAAALLIAVTGQSTSYTGALAYAYVVLRALYIAAYALGWKPWRSFIWLGALACPSLLYIAALL